MTYSVMSTRSFAVLGDFDTEDAARAAVQQSLSAGGADLGDVMVMVFDDSGVPVADFESAALARWAGIEAVA